MLEGLNWKVTKYEHVTLNELEMADDKRLGGVSDTPPVFLGLNQWILITKDENIYSATNFKIATLLN